MLKPDGLTTPSPPQYSKPIESSPIVSFRYNVSQVNDKNPSLAKKIKKRTGNVGCWG